MMICRPEMQRIDKWWKEGWLTHTFQRSLSEYIEGEWTNFLFQNIWAPTLKWNTDPADGPLDPEQWIWRNYGFDPDEVALIYWSQYGGNFFPEYFTNDTEFTQAMNLNNVDMISLIKAVALKNKLKYIKMIELAGFAYDPLNNVDAHELYSVFENHGTTKHEMSNTNQSASADTAVTTHAVTPYDSTDWKDESKDTNSTTVTGNTSPSASAGTASATGSSVTKPSFVQSGASATSDSTVHDNAKNTDSTGQQEDYTVAAKNNAFGQALKGADYYKAEKKRRYGNIGVTKTQELLEAERENLKFSLIQEFFDDINKVVLIGVY